jgi:hypothetical protein
MRDNPSPNATTIRPEPWLLLVHQLPARPVSLRVKTWRRLQQLGAVAVKNAVYALPNRAETREDFEWVRAEIVASGGQATVFHASTIESISSDDLRESFRRARRADYRAFVQSIEKVTRQSRGKRRLQPQALEKAQRAFRERLAQIERLDYFNAQGREDARAALLRLETTNAPAAAARANPTLDTAAFQKRHWLTRPRPGSDRMASAWLIRRFIDREARFLFGEPAAKSQKGALTFDTFEGDFTHEGDRCTFEVLTARFGFDEPQLREIAELVHDLDLKDGRFGRPEAPLLGTLVEGLQQIHDNDPELLERGIALFDALYRGQRQQPPAPHQRQKVAARPHARAKPAK